MNRPRRSVSSPILPPQPTPTITPLERKILQEIENSGSIPFSRFMELALYDPQQGYYVTRPHKMGRAGDFMTSPEVGPLFGRLMAIQCRSIWRAQGHPRLFRIIEFGPGRGTLCVSLIEFLRTLDQACYTALRYTLCEQNGELSRRLACDLPDSVRDTVETVAQSDFAGENDVLTFIIANEFLDALPVHRVVWRDGSLREVYVGRGENGFQTMEGELSEPLLAQYVEENAIPLCDGQEVTVNLEASRWLQRVVGERSALGLFLFDYGYSGREAVQHPSLADNVACYYRHTVNFDPLWRPGRQDITAHVDFGVLQRMARRLGLRVDCFQTQGQFLTRLVAAEGSAIAWVEDLSTRLNLKELVHPERMGSTLKVLALSKGLAPFIEPVAER